MNQQIVVREIVSPKPGGKQYSVIDTAGQRWGVFADDIGNYTVGGVYNIINSTSSVFKGQTYITLKEAEFVRMDGTPPATAPQPTRSPAPPQQFRNPAPAARPVAQPVAVSQSEAERSLQIFVCGAVNNMLSNPNINPLDLKAMDLIGFINNCTTAYRNTLGRSPRNDDMNDEIPI